MSKPNLTIRYTAWGSRQGMLAKIRPQKVVFRQTYALHDLPEDLRTCFEGYPELIEGAAQEEVEGDDGMAAAILGLTEAMEIRPGLIKVLAHGSQKAIAAGHATKDTEISRMRADLVLRRKRRYDDLNDQKDSFGRRVRRRAEMVLGGSKPELTLA